MKETTRLAETVFLRVALIAMLLLSAGCVGHCGPTLHRLMFSAALSATFDEANRTHAQDVVKAMGYNVTSSGPGGFSTAQRSDHTLWVQNGDNERPGTMIFNMWVNAGDREYDSGDRAREMGHRMAAEHWPTFNATLVDFNGRTGWTTSGTSTVEPQVIIC